MVKIVGEFIESDTSDSSDFLMINFSASSIPLQQRWQNNGLSACFIADYLSTFFPGEDDESLKRRAEIKEGVNFIANELLENAMKFNFPEGKSPVRLLIGLKQEQVLLYVTNCIDSSIVTTWQDGLNIMLAGDANELFMEQLIKNNKEGNEDSGLGYLSMINDWNAKLAWKFELIKSDKKIQKVTVMAQLPIC